MKQLTYLAFIFITFNVNAIDIIKYTRDTSNLNVLHDYKHKILESLLDITINEYGDYKINTVAKMMPRKRQFQELLDGELINLAFFLTNSEWETNLIPIRIPIRLGVLNYRLLMIHKKDVDKFAAITSTKQLKKLSVGVQRHWETREVMRELNYQIVDIYSNSAIFSMLENQRFDFIPRGPHEIYDEIKIRQKTEPNLVIAPNIALYIPAACYIFVSPNNPSLAKRVELGLEKMLKNGQLRALFNQRYQNNLKQADLKNRVIINIGNPRLPDSVPINQKELWVDINDY